MLQSTSCLYPELISGLRVFDFVRLQYLFFFLFFFLAHFLLFIIYKINVFCHVGKMNNKTIDQLQRGCFWQFRDSKILRSE